MIKVKLWEDEFDGLIDLHTEKPNIYIYIINVGKDNSEQEMGVTIKSHLENKKSN